MIRGPASTEWDAEDGFGIEKEKNLFDEGRVPFPNGGIDE